MVELAPSHTLSNFAVSNVTTLSRPYRSPQLVVRSTTNRTLHEWSCLGLAASIQILAGSKDNCKHHDVTIIILREIWNLSAFVTHTPSLDMHDHDMAHVMWSCSCNVSYLSVCRVDTAATRLPLPAWACHSNTHIVTIDGEYHRCFIPFMLLFHAPHFKFYYYCFVMLLIQSADLYKIKLVSYISGFCARHWTQVHFLNFLWVRESLPGYIGVVCCECEVVNCNGSSSF